MRCLEYYYTEIAEDENYQRTQILKGTGEKTYVYGGGDTAKCVIQKLEKFGLRPDGCFVDDRFHQKNMSCAGLEVIRRTDFLKNVLRSNVVIGFDPASAIKFALCDRELLGKGMVEVIDVDMGAYQNEIKSDWIKDHLSQLNEIFLGLADDESRQVFLAYLRAKASCIHAPQIPTLRSFFLEEEYFNSLYELCEIESKQKIFVDCGAFDGDTAFRIWSLHPDATKIYSFEPSDDNFSKLMKKKNIIPVLEPVKKGVWNETAQKHFCNNRIGSHISSDVSLPSVDLIAIDDFLEGKPATFIKMDVESSELMALHGCEKTIRTYMPMLAICVYHRFDDLLEIPSYLRSIGENDAYKYDFYLRQHSPTTRELVYYAVPIRKK